MEFRTQLNTNGFPDIEDGKDRNGKTKYKHHVVVARNVNEANVRDVKKDVIVTSKKNWS